MSDPITIFNVVLWLLVLTLLGVHLTGKKENKAILPLQGFGIPLREQMPMIVAPKIRGSEFEELISNGRPTIVMNTAIGCGACDGLYPIISNFSKENDVNIALFVDGSIEDIEKKIKDHSITASVFQVTDKVKSTLLIRMIPFSYYTGVDGVIYSKGAVADYPQLTLLFENGFQTEKVLNRALDELKSKQKNSDIMENEVKDV